MKNNATSHNETAPRFRGQILIKVYRVWLVRKFFPIFAAEVIGIAALLYWFTRAVFIQRVAENALNAFFANPIGIFPFFFAAFGETALSTKIVIFAVFFLGALFIRHVTQGILRFILVRENYFSKINRDARA